MAAGRDFGTLVNERRLALGYSLGQLANRLHTTASEVRAWERGQSAPNDEFVTKIAEALHLDEGELAAAAHRVAEPAKASPSPDADEATAVVVSPVFSDAADTGGHGEHPDAAGVPDAADGADPADVAASPPVAAQTPSPEPPAAPGPEPELAAVAVVAAGSAAGGDDAVRLADLPTESVPVVPADAAVDQVAPSRPTQPAQPQTRSALDPVSSFLRVVFDPDHRYLFWIRTALMVVVLLVFLRVLAWAVPAFFDTLREILDTIESSTTDTTLPGG